MLDPKIDVVFKLLLGREDNVSLLSAMIESVLDLPEPLAEVKVLNPEVPRELADHKAIALDLHVRCADGTHLDIEMETHPRPVLADRATYYLTSLHSSQLVHGEDYEELRPAKSILWLNGTLPPLGDRFHSTFSLREDEDHTRLTEQLELHFLCLPKLAQERRRVSPRLARWARFLLAPDDQALHALAMEDGTMKKAVHALERLSKDPDVVALVDTVERDRRFRRHEMAVERREGREEGLQLGMERGLERGRDETRRQLARKLLDDGMAVDHVAHLTELPRDLVEQLATETR